MLVVVALVLAQVAAASQAARPPECAPLASTTASNVWERAKYPVLRRYCDLLSNGAAKLASGAGSEDAREALHAADEASRTLSGHAAPAVLRGRALVALAQFREAVTAMEEASAMDPHALDDPAGLLAWGRALGRVGRTADAEAAYLSLLPRAAALPPAERGKGELEAGLLAQPRGAGGLAQAIALFRQAQRDAQDSLQVVAALALSLALDRAGEREESRVLEAGRRDPREALHDDRARDALADVDVLAEADALVAFALEDRDAAAAREAWARYLAGPGGKGPWADHARASGHGAKGVNAPKAAGVARGAKAVKSP